MCEGQLGNSLASIEAHKKSLEFDPNFKEAKLNFAQIHKDLGNFEIAGAYVRIFYIDVYIFSFNIFLYVSSSFLLFFHSLLFFPYFFSYFFSYTIFFSTRLYSFFRLSSPLLSTAFFSYLSCTSRIFTFPPSILSSFSLRQFSISLPSTSPTIFIFSNFLICSIFDLFHILIQY